MDGEGNLRKWKLDTIEDYHDEIMMSMRTVADE
jgi:hypothetical protein